MLDVHPFARLIAVVATAAAAFLLRRPEPLAALYALILAGVATAGILARHARFVGSVGLPLLVALLLLWAVIAEPPPGEALTGVEYALSLWLRILVLGAAFQWLLLPLAECPLHLKDFLRVLRLPHSLGALLIAPIIFLPEIRRRIGRIADARTAQGLPSRGIAGLRALPAMMVPLVGSLLESSIARSELWTHRSLLSRQSGGIGKLGYRAGPSLAVALLSLGALIAAAATWI